jgi:hypothetical protein
VFVLCAVCCVLCAGSAGEWWHVMACKMRQYLHAKTKRNHH